MRDERLTAIRKYAVDCSTYFIWHRYFFIKQCIELLMIIVEIWLCCKKNMDLHQTFEGECIYNINLR